MVVGQRVWVNGVGGGYWPAVVIEINDQRGVLIHFEHGGGGWMMPSELYEERPKTGNPSPLLAYSRSRRSLSDDAVRAIRQRAGTTTLTRLAAEFGVHPATIRAIINGKTYKEVTA